MEKDGIILMERRETKTPYVLKTTGTGVYSVEELSYYIYHNIYLFTEEMVDEHLIKWLKDEVGDSVLAEKLASCKKGGNDLKDIVTTILCSNDFYSEREIKFLIGIMEDMEKLSMPMRRKMKADALIISGNYHTAALEYEGLLKMGIKEEFTREEYGNILHNMGVAHIHTTSLKEASHEFKEAYACNNNRESLHCYLMALKLSGKEELFKGECRQMEISEEEKQGIEDRIFNAGVEAKNLAISRKLRELKNLKLMGRVNEYYQGIDYIMECWKQEYKKDVG